MIREEEEDGEGDRIWEMVVANFSNKKESVIENEEEEGGEKAELLISSQLTSHVRAPSNIICAAYHHDTPVRHRCLAVSSRLNCQILCNFTDGVNKCATK